MVRRVSFLLSALVPLIATPAFAGTLHTPFTFVGDDQTPSCVISNVDSKEIEVVVSGTSIGGSTRTPISNSCPTPPGTLNAGATCVVQYADSADLSCHFTVKGKVRASAQLTDAAGNLAVAVPATAK